MRAGGISTGYPGPKKGERFFLYTRFYTEAKLLQSSSTEGPMSERNANDRALQRAKQYPHAVIWVAEAMIEYSCEPSPVKTGPVTL